MTRAGDEMILELVGLLKTAAKDEDKDKPKKDEKKEDKKDKKVCKECDKEDCACGPMKKDKKAKMAEVLTNLVKIANTLDEAGAEDAAVMVDDVLQIILKDMNKQAMDMPELMADDEEEDEEDEKEDEEEEDDVALVDEGFEDEPAPVDVGVPPEEDMPEMGGAGDDPADLPQLDSEMAQLLIENGWTPPKGQSFNF